MAVLFIFMVNVLGLLAELFLLGHYESPLQQSPFYFMVLSSASLALAGFVAATWAKRLAQAVLLGTLVLGIAGIYFHFDENAAFELEMYPKMGGTELIWESLTGATPVLAPGAIVGLALIGLLYIYLLKPSSSH